jgi:hypothetical protein
VRASSHLEHIQSKLDEITSQNALRAVLFRQLNEEKVRGCADRFANVLENFNASESLKSLFVYILTIFFSIPTQLSCQIEDSNALEHISQQLMEINERQKLRT